MFKKIKYVSSVIIVLFMIFLPVLSFANEELPYTEKTLNGRTTVNLWGNEEYEYIGELGSEWLTVESSYIPGEIISDDDSEEYDTSKTGYRCFGIKAGKAGYYLLGFRDPDGLIGSVYVRKNNSEVTDGLFKKSEYTLDETCEYNGIIFSMDDGESEYAFFTECATGKYSADLIYLGEEILSAEVDGPLIYDYECSFDPQDLGRNEYVMYPNISLDFSGGEQVIVSKYSVSTEKYVPGKPMKADTEILDRHFIVDVTFVSLDDLVKDISLPENFKASCRMKYDMMLYDFVISPETVLVTDAGGTTREIENNSYAILSNGRKYPVYFEFGCDEENNDTRIPLKYGLFGLKEKSVIITPECDDVVTTFRKIFSDSGKDIAFGISILSGKAEDYTSGEAFSFIFSVFRRTVKAVSTYRLIGSGMNAFLLILLFLLPIATVVLIIILLFFGRKKKIIKKYKL